MSDHTAIHDWCEHYEGIQYVTTKDLTWELGHVGSGMTYVVPANEFFDVSIPWFLQWVFSPHNPSYHKAAAIHDHMLVNGWDRPTAGGVFHEALKTAGVGTFTRLAMFFAVTLRKWR